MSAGAVISESDSRKVRSILEKRTDGEIIFLDWNAFDAVSAIKEPELKDIAARLLPDLEYALVQDELRVAIAKKRKEMLAFAKARVTVRMLDECQRLQLVTFNGIKVATKDALREYFKESNNEEHHQAINRVTNLCFTDSPRWKEDMTDEMMQHFGIRYDEKTIKIHENGKGNGFFEKIVTKGLCNVRADLRSAQGRANVGVAVPRIKRSQEDAYDYDGKYMRKSAAPVSVCYNFWLCLSYSESNVFFTSLSLVPEVE